MIGCFSNKGDEYTIKNYKLKRKMFNYMWNSKIMCAVSHLSGGDDMYNTIKKILPDNEANLSEYSGAEPYTLTNMYYGPAHARPGETRFSWITGTASWVYRAITQYVLGFHPGYDTITFDPCIPKSWKRLSGRRFFRNDIYNIEIINENNNSKGIKELYVDDIKISGNKLNIFGDNKEHFVRIIL